MLPYRMIHFENLCNYSSRNTHLLRVSYEKVNFSMFKPLRRRRIFMGLNVTVHGSGQLQIYVIIQVEIRIYCMFRKKK